LRCSLRLGPKAVKNAACCCFFTKQHSNNKQN
jgi:hypothetical protein